MRLSNTTARLQAFSSKRCVGKKDRPLNSRPIPILLMVRELNHGGIERDVTKIAIHIDRSRFDPHVASYQAEGMRYEELRRANIPLLHVPLSSFLSKSAVLGAIRFCRY